MLDKVENKFKIKGCFYENGNFKFRKYLNIIKKKTNALTPDLMVIMMNPGSSSPIGNYNNIETETIPDPTQEQIMRIMEKCDFNFARVLNLSDLIESKSKNLYSKIDGLRRENISHSIFEINRESEFKMLFVKGIPVIYAWGVSKKLKKLAEKAMRQINEPNPIGLQKEGFEYAYYHPYPRGNGNKQKEWLEKVTLMINRVHNTI